MIEWLRDSRADHDDFLCFEPVGEEKTGKDSRWVPANASVLLFVASRLETDRKTLFSWGEEGQLRDQTTSSFT